MSPRMRAFHFLTFHNQFIVLHIIYHVGFRFKKAQHFGIGYAVFFAQYGGNIPLGLLVEWPSEDSHITISETILY
jgi:hypothetical protein